MEVLATIVMMAWIPVQLVLFAVLPPRRAVLVAFLTAWLFLPMASYRIPFLPDYTKMSATSTGVLMGAVLFDGKRILRFSPGWIDLPIIAFCICPFVSSIANGLGTWDGVSGMLTYIVTWAMPYHIGRLYFTDFDECRELAIGIFIGGLLYIPLCLFEVRMSPVLHEMVYGFEPRVNQLRYGAWRPAVFMDGGLAVGLWMVSASLIGLWMWRTNSLKRFLGVSTTWLAWPLLVTAILCRSVGALLLMALGLSTLMACSVTRSRLALFCFIVIAPTYILLRISDVWHAEQITALAQAFDPKRAESFEFRIKNENILVEKALVRPMFGWGGWDVVASTTRTDGMFPLPTVAG
jgi:hypothetical protein